MRKITFNEWDKLKKGYLGVLVLLALLYCASLANAGSGSGKITGYFVYTNGSNSL